MDLPAELGSNFKATSRPLADFAVHGDRQKGIDTEANQAT